MSAKTIADKKREEYLKKQVESWPDWKKKHGSYQVLVINSFKHNEGKKYSPVAI